MNIKEIEKNVTRKLGRAKFLAGQLSEKSRKAYEGKVLKTSFEQVFKDCDLSIRKLRRVQLIAWSLSLVYVCSALCIADLFLRPNLSQVGYFFLFTILIGAVGYIVFGYPYIELAKARVVSFGNQLDTFIFSAKAASLNSVKGEVNSSLSEEVMVYQLVMAAERVILAEEEYRMAMRNEGKEIKRVIFTANELLCARVRFEELNTIVSNFDAAPSRREVFDMAQKELKTGSYG